ncbi:MAG TPA: SET domain-containing protein [Verrucomicrobiales bacterium]|nr:SET domain-containing protein [Verrucomicrobiales bacterium]HIL70815.1 SET domain-containing protein [Verrucomicrobiota bacterium]
MPERPFQAFRWKTMKKTSSPFIIVKRSKIHGTGVFAAKFIPEDTRIIEYVGDKVTKKESERRGQLCFEDSLNNKELGAVYMFILNKRYDIDGNVPYNTAKYINHSCGKNCYTDVIKGKIWIIAERDIEAGEELSYNYSYDLDNYEDHPCRCGSEDCVGYIVSEEQWANLKRRLKRAAKSSKATENEA